MAGVSGVVALVDLVDLVLGVLSHVPSNQYPQGVSFLRHYA